MSAVYIDAGPPAGALASALCLTAWHEGLSACLAGCLGEYQAVTVAVAWLDQLFGLRALARCVLPSPGMPCAMHACLLNSFPV